MANLRGRELVRDLGGDAPAMSKTDQEQRSPSRPGLYQEITDRIIQQIEAGIIPWVQPWAPSYFRASLSNPSPHVETPLHHNPLRY
jgi:antirestriction protein ArdC